MKQLSGAFAASLSFALLAQNVVAQDAPSLEQLADLVQKAHRTDAGPAPESFRADLRIEELAKNAEEHRGQMELEVAFLDWKHPDTGRSYPLIRYKQTDSARSIEQGRDREDYWAFADGKQLDMRSREMATDLEHARRNIQLARQMLKFVDADSVLRSLQSPSAVAAAELAQGRAKKVPCWTVSGKLPSFPLRQNDGVASEVEAKLFIERETSLLIGIEARPVAKQKTKAEDATHGETKDEAKPAQAPGEFIRLSEHENVAGRVVPKRMAHFAVDDDGTRRAQLGIDLTTIDLKTKLEAKDFDRKKQ